MRPSGGVNLIALVSRSPQHLLQAIAISPHDLDTGIEHRPQTDTACLGSLPYRLDRALHDLVNLQRLHLEMNLSGNDPAHVEQIADDLRLHAHVAIDRLESAREIFGRHRFLAQHRRPTLDRRQWRAQLVRQRREELVLEMPESLRFGASGAFGFQQALALGFALAQLTKQPGVCHGDRRLRSDAECETLFTLPEHVRRFVAEEQAADDFTRVRFYRHGEITADRKMPSRHPVVRLVMPVARILANIAGPNHSLAMESRAEHGRVPRHRELRELFTRRPGQGVEPVTLLRVLHDVVEKRAELGAGNLSHRIGHDLHDALQIELGRDGRAQAVQCLERMRFFQQRLLDPPACRDIMSDLGGAHDRAVGVLDPAIPVREMSRSAPLL